MKRPDFNGPWISLAAVFLLATWGAFYANPNNVLEFGRWAAGPNWNPSFHLLWDRTGAEFTITALLALLGSSVWAPLRWKDLGLGLMLGFASVAGNAELLLLGWMFFGLVLVAERRSGIWFAASCLTLLLAILGLHAIFGSSDFRECLRLSQEPYDFPTRPALRTAQLLAVTLLSQITAVALLRDKSVSEKLRLRALVLLAGGLVAARYAFLSSIAASFFPLGPQAVFSVSVVFVLALFGAAFWKARSTEAETPAPPTTPSSHLRRWNTTVEKGVLWLEEGFWPGIWHIPVQACRTIGLFLDYWQGGTPQYTLLVILLGTLVLFWAALKTQVIW